MTTDNQSKAVNDMKSQLQLNFFTNVVEPQPVFFYRMTMMKNCPQKVTTSTCVVPGWSERMVLGGGRGRPKDFRMNKTVCEPCLNMFIFLMLFT